MKFILFSLLYILSFLPVLSQSWKEMDMQVQELYNKGEYEKAIPIAEEEIEAVKKEVGEVHPEYDSTLKNLGDLYLASNQYEKAEAYYVKVREFRRRLLGECNLTFAESLITLGELYYYMGQYESAEPVFTQAKNIYREISGENSALYSKSISDLALINTALGQYEKAEPLYLESLKITHNLSGEKSSEFGADLLNLAELYRHMNQYQKAEPYYLQAINIYRSGKTDDFNYPTCVNNLAYFYMEIGQYDKSIPLFNESKEIIKKTLGENHTNYAYTLENLGNLYAHLGEYEKAEALFLEAKDKLKKELGENHHDYAFIIGSLANFYSQIGDYDKAEPLNETVNEIFKKTLGENSADYALGLNNLGSLYTCMNKYDKAFMVLDMAKTIYEKNKGDNLINYATCLENLGQAYINSGQPEDAEHLLRQSMAIKKKAIGENSVEYANTLNKIGNFYCATGQYKPALQFCSQAIHIYEKTFGSNHPDFSQSCFDLANIYGLLKNTFEANNFYYRGFKSQHNQLEKIFKFTTESEKEHYIKKIADFQRYFLSFLIGNPSASHGFTYDLSLSSRNLILSSSQQLRLAIFNSTDSSIQNNYDKWIGLREQLSFWYAKPIAERPGYIKDLEDQASALEKELTRSSSAFKNEQSKNESSWQVIQQNLKPNEAAIEFVDFNFYNGKRYTDSTYYIALLLRKDKPQPQLIKLFEKKQLDSLLNNNSDINNLYKQNTSLYKVAWEPLEKYLTGISKIYFAPAGNLFKISFAALPLDNKKVLSDKYKLVQLNTTASVTDKKENFITASDKIQLYGGIQYNADTTALKEVVVAYNSNHRIGQAGNEVAIRSLPDNLERGSSIQFLPGTEKEVEEIKEDAGKANTNVTILSGINATEESFKALNGSASPSVLHIATHGFFFPDPKEDKRDSVERMFETSAKVFRQSDNPLFRSGLLFAGAGNAWQGKSVSGIEDGIVTAYDVSNMYLLNTKLVVISACETALGDIHGSEGVYGLQRAFKIAGGQNLVMSLWKVPDAETSDFMQLFYKNLFAKQSISDAFYNAQTIMKNKYRDEPYKWAAWILVR